MAINEIEFGAVGIDTMVAQMARGAQALDNIAAAASRTTPKAAQAGASLRAAGAGAQSLGQSLQQGASRIQGAASSIASLTNALGGSGSGRAAGLVSSIAGTVAQGAALGVTFGPQGALIGGMAAAAVTIAGLASAHRDAASAAEEHATALDAARVAIATMRSASAQSDIAAGVFGDDMTAERAREEREVRRQRIVEIQQTLETESDLLHRAARVSMGISDEAHTSRMMQLSAEAERARLEIENLDGLAALRSGNASSGFVAPGAIDVSAEAVANRGGAGGTTPARGGRRGGGGGRGNDGEQARLMAAYDAQTQAAEAANEAEQRRLDLASDAAEARDTLRQANDDKATESLRGQIALNGELQAAEAARMEAHREQAERTTETITAMQERETEAQREYASVAISAVQGVAEGIGAAIEQVMATNATAEEAGKIALATTLELIGETAGMLAGMEYAKAIASYPDYAGMALHAAAGVAFTAIAVATGAGSSALQRDVSASQSARADAEKIKNEGSDNRDLASRSVSSGGGNQAPMVINVYGHYMGSEREVQGWIYQAIDGGARDGRRMDPRALRGTGMG